MIFFEWWAGLPPIIRFGVAVLFLGISTAFWIGGRFWPWGWVVGAVLLAMAIPSRAERKGYHDF